MRCAVADFGNGGLEAGGIASLAQLPGMGMFRFHDDARRLHLRMSQHLAARQHRRTGDAGLFEAPQPFLGRFGQERLLRHFQALVGVAIAASGRFEALVVQPFGVADGVAQAVPLIVAHHRNADVAAGGFVDEVDEGGGGGHVHFLANEGLAAHVGRPHEGDDGIEHGEAHMLTFTASLAGEERGRHGLRGGDAR